MASDTNEIYIFYISPKLDREMKLLSPTSVLFFEVVAAEAKGS